MKNIFWNATEKRLRSFWRLVIYLLFVAGLIELITLVARTISDATNGFGGNMPVIRVVNGLIILFGLLGAAALAAWRLDRRSFADFGFHFNRRWWGDLGFGLILGALLMGLIFLVEWAAGWIQIQGTQANHYPDWSFAAWMGSNALFFICVGIYEEFFTRGYLLRNLAEGLRIGRLQPRSALLIAYLISSSIFGVLHLGNPNTNLVSTLNLILAGLFLGLGYVLTGELAISIGLHITWNFFQGPVFGFSVSGGASAASFVGIQQLGPAWVTGGAFGPEAGVIGLAAMLLGSLLIVLWVKRIRGTASLRDHLAVYPLQPAQPAVGITDSSAETISSKDS